MQQSQPVSLMEVLASLKVLASEHGEEFCQVSVEVQHQRNNRPLVLNYRVYINPGQSAQGSTPQEALAKLRAKYDGAKTKQVLPSDVLV